MLFSLRLSLLLFFRPVRVWVPVAQAFSNLNSGATEWARSFFSVLVFFQVYWKAFAALWIGTFKKFSCFLHLLVSHPSSINVFDKQCAA